MSFLSIDRIAVKGFKLLRRYNDFGWRKVLSLCVAIALLNLTLAALPLSINTEFDLLLTPAVFILAALLFGPLPGLIATSLLGLASAIFHNSAADPLISYTASLVAVMVLRARMHAMVATLIYSVACVFLVAIAGLPKSNSWLRDLDAAFVASILNLVFAAAIYSLLPRRTYIWQPVRLPPVSLTYFWSMTAASMPMLSVMALSTHDADHSAMGAVSPLAILTSSIVLALAICGALAHAVEASMKPLVALVIGSAEGSKVQASSMRYPLFDPRVVAARLKRRMRRQAGALERESNQLLELRAHNQRQGATLLSLTNRLRTQSHTLLQTQHRDTNNLKELEEALQEARHTIEDIRRNRNLFVAMMSHEVRTPLHGLMSTLSLLREESLSTEGEHRLDIARTSARMLLKIANDILDFSRINAGGFSFETAPFDARKLINEIVEEFQATARAHNLSLGAAIAEEFPGALLGDRNRIHQIVSNLVTNALKFTEHGGVTLRMSWRDGSAVIDVADTGKGIPAEKRDSIFDSFVRGESAHSRRFGGAGLGLTISRYLAQAMSGSLELHVSGPDGSVFRLELKLAQTDEPVPEEISQRILAHPTGHILVVEDNDANQYVTRVLLESLDCTVVVAASGKIALQRIHEEEFDLVLMDCQMPEMDGYETARRMRDTLAKRIPIVAMTADALPEDGPRRVEAGMDDFLPKPFGKGGLSKILRQWLADDAASRKHASEPPLDLTVFNELWQGMHWRIKPLEAVYEAFTQNVRNLMAQLSALGSTPMTSVMRSLHTVRGSAGMLGAKRIARTAALLQHCANNQQLTKEAVDSAQLPKELRDLELAVAKCIAPYADGRHANS